MIAAADSSSWVWVLLKYLVPVELQVLPRNWCLRNSNHVQAFALYQQATCSRILLEKPTIAPARQNVLRLLWTRRYITMFTRARHLTLSYASLMQCTPTHITSWRSILNVTFPSTPTLPKPTLLFQLKWCLHLQCLPMHATCPTNGILLDITLSARSVHFLIF
jgi:hypothetical protein